MKIEAKRGNAMARWTRRRLLAGGGGAALLAAGGGARSQDLPFSGPIRILAGFAAGGQSDVLARLVAERMSAALGRGVIVENRLGAGGAVAAEQLKTATPDGSTLLLSNIVVMSLATLSTPDLRYEASRDFAPILQAVEYQLALATGPATGARDLAGLSAWLKAHPDRASYGVPAAGSLPHLYGVALANALGLSLTMVPFRGGSPIVTALAGGHVAAGLAGAGDFAEQHRSGVIRLIALSGTGRHPALPDVPTFSELGLRGFEENGWNGFFAPKATPAPVVELYARTIRDALAGPEMRGKVEALGLNVAILSGAELAARIPVERERWRPIVRALNP